MVGSRSIWSVADLCRVDVTGARSATVSLPFGLDEVVELTRVMACEHVAHR